MKLENLKPAKGATKASKRVGRGEGSGHGGTATRGMNGAKSRSGYAHKIGFEGGQMPIQRRLPKFGFKNPTRVEYKPVNLSVINALAVDADLNEVTIDDLFTAGLISKNEIVKVLGKGEITKAVNVVANAFSKSATEKIQAAGGTATVIE
ncbi:MAG: 50S ribosomal protein L15 [Bacteroidales bacterium]|jgi:large subunit ribosomal protein L15|nr:50S ribosomal protein L15 [Bacteroidales bacterium]MBQ1905169.1 50S ribosomal protein L15 [Bacteroidales bacterium]MBQ2104538.1 50S ribosomal protein L15 [Bacteroidales bacterium]MBQ2500871.1 50S ribosomal protein L15 [Bacteroidales bacterium]MBQ3975994.1 50S ribosomal protein L15 [Bacteroidales bacterium]